MKLPRALQAGSLGFVLLVGWAAGRGAFPSGADLANILYHGRLVLEGTLPPYPPLLPAVGALAWSMAGGDWDIAIALLRVLPGLAFGLLVLAGHRCLRQWGHAEPAPSLAALLVAASGPLWFAMAWGAVPMVVGLATVLLGIGAWAGEKGSPWPWRTTAWITLSLLANPYPVVFAALTAMGLAIRHRRAAVNALRLHGLWTLLPATVAAVVYLILLPGPKPGSVLEIAGPAGVARMLALQAAMMGPWMWFIALALGAVVVGRRLARVPAIDLDWLSMAAALFLGAVVLQAFTLMNLVGRMLYALAVLAPLAVAAHHAGLRRPSPGTWKGVLMGIAVAMVALPYQADALMEATEYYRPSADLATLIEAIPPGEGGLSVHGGEPPTLTSWWLRAATGRPTWTGGDPWPHSFVGDLHRNQAARTWVEGTAWVRLGDAVLASGGCTGTGLRLSSQGLLHGDALASLPDAMTGFTTADAFHATRPHLQWVDDATIVDGGGEGIAWTRRIEGDQRGFLVSWNGPSGAEWNSVWEAPPGAAFRVTESDGGHRVQVVRAGGLAPPGFVVWPSPGAAFSMDPGGHWFRLDWHDSAPAVRVAVDGSARGLSADVASRAGAWSEDDIRFVYVNDMAALPGSERDGALVPHAKADGAVLHRVVGTRSCPSTPPAS